MITVSIYDHNNEITLYKESFEDNPSGHRAIRNKMQDVLSKLFRKSLERHFTKHKKKW